MKKLLVATLVDRSKLKLEKWYDKQARNWICQLKDRDGFDVGDAIVVGTKQDALNVTKESFNIDSARDAENEDRYGFSIPLEFRQSVRKFVALVEANPGKLQLWDVKTRKLLLTAIGKQSNTLVSTRDATGARGLCGVLPIIKWLKAKTVRLWCDGREIRLKDLQ